MAVLVRFDGENIARLFVTVKGFHRYIKYQKAKSKNT